PDEIPADPVPTSIAIGPDGALYVGELKGFPAIPGTSRIWRIAPNARHAQCGTSSACRVVASGFTSIIDMSFGRNGTAYVVELDEASWLAVEGGEGQGGTVNACNIRTRPWSCSEVASGLPIPTAVAIDRGSIYVTLFGLVPGEAQVARLR
ncbi:MAG: ScyD/ScyE family protein, partial [Thermoleophilia bacterium]|nr:ScyD/ScyE family protein [Thermoleophilia bacterium]